MKNIKAQFPIFSQKPNGKPLIYLDSASTTQKPKQVIKAISDFYQTTNANIHRGVYTIAENATEQYENARLVVAEFVNATSQNEIIFTRNATESINLVAKTWGQQNIKSGDEIVLSDYEHHANFVPWFELAKAKKATLKFIPLKKDFTLDLEKAQKIIGKKTRLIAVSGMSNVLGTKTDIKKIALIKEKNCPHAKLFIDGAQLAAHKIIDVQKLNCDFLALSAHKILGPTGLGVLYAKAELLNQMSPFLHGGYMIKEVNKSQITYAEAPTRFEAGTPNIADTIAFVEAIKFIQNIGMEKIEEHSKKLYTLAYSGLSKLPNLTIYGAPPKNPLSGSVLSFTIKGVHPHDIASILAQEGVCIRSGRHCSEPLMNELKIGSTARASFYIYNDESDVKAFVKAVKKVYKVFKI